MSSGFRVSISESLDPWRHAALEEALMHRTGQTGERHVFFYVNRPCVVIGKNQNPWMECDMERAEREGVPLLRRCSGGGTVVQDEGNLNIALILPREGYRADEQMEAMCLALASLGVPAERHLRTGLAVGGRKFSGQAFCLRGRAALHHGTLLLRSDLARLRALLRPPDGVRFETHAIRSIPSPVMNLSEIRPELTMELLRQTLIGEIARAWKCDPLPSRWDDAALDTMEWRPRAALLSSWEWIFGETPDFTVTRTDAAGPPRCLRVSGGRVATRPGARSEEEEWISKNADHPFSISALRDEGGA